MIIVEKPMNQSKLRDWKLGSLSANSVISLSLSMVLMMVSTGPSISESLIERVSRFENVGALTARGVVMANAEVTFRSDLAAPVSGLPIKAGSAFKSGDELISFDCGKQNADTRGAQEFENKQLLIFENRKKLKSRNAASAFEVADARADYLIAKAKTDSLKQVSRFCKINAPFDGKVLELHAAKFETPGVNTPLITVVDDSMLELDLIVPSKWLRWLTVSSKFDFEVEETGKTYTASILRLGAKIDAVSQTIKITGSFNARPERVLPGMSGVARFDPPTQ
jgi:membrane fusion protein (multidrug efflux system)